MIVIIDNYDSFTYNLVQFLGSMGHEIRVFRNDEITLGELELLKFSQLVISPGPGWPAQAGITISAIRHFRGRAPILGVCLGHQAIAEAYGAKIILAPEIVHGKASPVFHQEKGLFRHLPNPLFVGRYHSLVVDAETLPPELEVIAVTDNQIPMAIQHKTDAVFGVQFHPESALTPQGYQLLQNFVNM